MKMIKYFSLLLFIGFISCEKETKTISELENIHAIIKAEFAHDKRVELFDVNFELSDNQLILEGETTSKKAFSILIDSLNHRKLKFTNNVRVLPDSAVGALKYAIARNSVINIRSKPKHSAELGTQGLLGMPLKVLDKNILNQNEALFVVDISDSLGNNYEYRTFPIRNTPPTETDSWKPNSYRIEIKEIRSAKDKIKLYIWNKGMEEFWVDDIEIKIATVE